jgi:hypothetical protein
LSSSPVLGICSITRRGTQLSARLNGSPLTPGCCGLKSRPLPHRC